MARSHQPGEAVFRSVLPEDIEWKPFPAFPPSVRLAVVVGQPSEPGPYVIRVKVPSGVKLMPHKHPEDRIYTVMSGFSISASATGSAATRCRLIRPAASSFCPAIPGISTGRSPVNTSPRSRPLVRWAWSTWIPATIRVSKIADSRSHQLGPDRDRSVSHHYSGPDVSFPHGVGSHFPIG
jgi:hypothetical protein